MYIVCYKYYDNGNKPVNSIPLETMEKALAYLTFRAKYMMNSPNDYSIVQGDSLYPEFGEVESDFLSSGHEPTTNELGDVSP
jgi:hypothetical protein